MSDERMSKFPALCQTVYQGPTWVRFLSLKNAKTSRDTVTLSKRTGVVNNVTARFVTSRLCSRYTTPPTRKIKNSQKVSRQIYHVSSPWLNTIFQRGGSFPMHQDGEGLLHQNRLSQQRHQICSQLATSSISIYTSAWITKEIHYVKK